MGRIRNLVAENAIAGATAVTAFTPIGALVEKLNGTSTPSSIASRTLSGAWTIGSVTLLYCTRNAFRPYFGVTEASPQYVQDRFDRLYAFGASVIVRPLFYLAAGEHDLERIVMNTAGIAVLSALIAPPAMKLIEIGKEITGKEESTYTPQWLRKAAEKSCRTVIAGAIAASLTLTATVYALTPWEARKPLYHSIVKRVTQTYGMHETPTAR